MEFKTAVEILELDSQNLTSAEIKKAYRRLSMKYHPDVSTNTDGSKFILINAAYEFLIKNLSFINNEDFLETEDELISRISLIRKAFEMIRVEYITKHNQVFEAIVNNLIDNLNSYTSHKKLRQSINSNFSIIVENGINQIINWFNIKISKIISSYDDWINGYLRSTYQKLLEDEFKFWYKSKYFYKHITISLLISLFLLTLVYFVIDNKYYGSLSALPIIMGIFTYRSNVRKKYSFKENIKTLDSSKFSIHSSKLAVKSDDSASIGEASIGFGSVGAMIGLIGGPVGAAIGGAIGGFLGGLFGESVDELRQKLFDRLVPKIAEVEEIVLKNLEEQLPKIEEELIKTIKNNFNKNKERAVKLLLQSNH